MRTLVILFLQFSFHLFRFLVYAKRIDPNEARLRVFCMTDDREDKTLEGLESFTEVAKSKDVEVLEGKPQYLEMAGNLSPSKVSLIIR